MTIRGYDQWKTASPDDQWLSDNDMPPPCEWNYVGRMHDHPRFPSGSCVVCGAEAHEGCKHELAVGEFKPNEGE